MKMILLQRTGGNDEPTLSGRYWYSVMKIVHLHITGRNNKPAIIKGRCLMLSYENWSSCNLKAGACYSVMKNGISNKYVT